MITEEKKTAVKAEIKFLAGPQNRWKELQFAINNTMLTWISG
jgi:hypothetical protein